MMEKSSLICLPFACLTVGAAFAGGGELQYSNQLPSVTWDGRFGTTCNSYGTNNQLCFVPYSRLVSHPEKYDGMYVVVTGFLAIRFGQPTLYPSRDSANAGVSIESITVIVTGAPESIRALLKVGEYVTVIGMFDGKSFGFGEPQLGLLRDIQRVEPVSKHSSEGSFK